MKETVCSICNRVYEYTRSKGHSKTKCNSCLVNQRRFKTKEKLVDYKGGKCVKCGYNKCISALQFHHLDSKEKDFQISGNHTRKFETLKKEVDKCILVCANCHIELHYT